MWYSRLGGLTFACDYDLLEFPADRQKCTMRFASLLYYADLITYSVPQSFMTVVCIISILGFWVSDLVARLTLSITALLTTMTIQWSVSAELPVSREFTWIALEIEMTNIAEVNNAEMEDDEEEGLIGTQSLK
eukprot:gene28800-35724_t